MDDKNFIKNRVLNNRDLFTDKEFEQIEKDLQNNDNMIIYKTYKLGFLDGNN